MTDTVDVCIIGSGVAGLSAALSLQQRGFSVVVYERDGDFIDRKQGYGLTLTYSTNGPLSKLGVLDECIENNCPSHSHYVFDPAGNVLGYYGRELLQNSVPKQTDHGGNKGNLRIPRQDLRMMLIQKLRPETIVWGWTLQEYEEKQDCVEVRLVQSKGGPSGTPPAVTTIRAHVLVGADGIRSIVRQQRDIRHFQRKSASKRNASNAEGSSVPATVSPIHYLGVAVIIGLSNAMHPHINNRGFYVVDGENRLFTMPYVAPVKSEADSANAQPGLTMWQLSFSGLNESEASTLRKSAPARILEEALRRTEGWFVPVQDMIRATLEGELWATGLYDRDPLPLFTKDSSGAAGSGGSRVTVIGDAAHPMSMFKGQGANQALADGPLLAQWLSGEAGAGAGGGAAKRKRDKQSAENDGSDGANGTSASASSGGSMLANQQVVFTRLRCFERDMAARTTPKVLASREAAQHLHSPAVLQDVFGIAGMPTMGPDQNTAMLAVLKEAGVTAALGDRLDAEMKRVLCDHGTDGRTAGNEADAKSC